MNAARKFTTARVAYSRCAANMHYNARTSVFSWALVSNATRARAGRLSHIICSCRNRFYVIVGERA